MKSLFYVFILLVLLIALAFAAGIYVEWRYEVLFDILSNIGVI